ncbi:MAG: DUF4230 domain-containing protein [Candidatus Promineifilaceae bacterium]
MNEKAQTARPARTAASGLLILLLLIGCLAAGFIGLAAYSSYRGVRAVSDPVGALFQRLMREATPVVVPNPVVVLQEVKSLARLETASYSFQDVIEIERNQDFLFGAFGESLLFVAYGEVIAGVDLAKLGPNDLQVVDQDTIMIHLPPAEVLVTRLDNERSHVADRDEGIFAQSDPQLETMVRQEAERRILEAALESGILERADAEAESFMRMFLGELGFSDVIFTESAPPPLTPAVPTIPKGFGTPPPTAPVTPLPAH